MPEGLLGRLMGSQNAWSVPAAAVIGLPLYVSEASLPLVKSFADAGMGLGAVMAFMIILLVGGMAGGWLFELVTAFLVGG